MLHVIGTYKAGYYIGDMYIIKVYDVNILFRYHIRLHG